MNILETLAAGGGRNSIENLARSFGLDPKQTTAVLAAVLPELAYNMERQSFNRGGLADLVAALGKADYSKALQPDAQLTSPAVQQAGVEALDTVLWSKDRSRTVAHRAARATGVDETLIRNMMPAIAAMFMGGIESKTHNAFGTLSEELGGNARPATASIDVGDQRPLPIPGERPGSVGSNNPYGDLSDIIRRGGTRLPENAPQRVPRRSSGNGDSIDLPGGMSLDKIIRDLLGGAAGFQSKGIIGWIIRYFLVRWGWNFIQGILRRLLTGR